MAFDQVSDLFFFLFSVSVPFFNPKAECSFLALEKCSSAL